MCPRAQSAPGAGEASNKGPARHWRLAFPSARPVSSEGPSPASRLPGCRTTRKAQIGGSFAARRLGPGCGLPHGSHGGKDSCYNMMQCVVAGHQIVALANLRPAENQVGSDELDSYMYQTVGHHAIDLYAEAMALPLYRHTIRGRSVDTGRVYTKCEGDEVEDLYELLKLVKEKEEVEGISVGAILSDYQRVRVENVCKRLNLQPLAYLWQRNQEDLLREMISSNIQAIIIKVAALGLDPDKHLGKTLDQMEPYLLELSKKYGVHVCGEGGEYETFTLDCPLFKKKIIVDSSEVVIHSADAFAPVAYLRFLELHLEDKVPPVSDNCRTSNYIHPS
uniref:Diphthine--ammonia ligase n=4 Tax=Canis lupus TaxID=9612 RepID=A0A8I3PPP7_CANLF